MNRSSMLASRVSVYFHRASRQIDMSTKLEITALGSEDEVDAAVDAANVARIGAAQGERLCRKRHARFASGFENHVALQGITDRPTNVGVCLGERQRFLGFLLDEGDVGSGNALDREDAALRRFDHGACSLLRLRIDQ